MAEERAVARVFFVDLDNTLFHSVRRNTKDHQRLAYHDADGRPMGFSTATQVKLHTWLDATGLLIPVTMRSLEALERTLIDFPSWRVCCGGGLILTPEGEVDERWRAQMQRELAPYQGVLRELSDAWVEAACEEGVPLRHRLVSDEALGMYLELKHRERLASSFQAFLERHRTHLLPDGWELHVTDHTATMAPPCLSKGAAVGYLKQRFPDAMSVGVGDSGADYSLMERCDFAMLPVSSHLFRWLGERIGEGT